MSDAAFGILVLISLLTLSLSLGLGIGKDWGYYDGQIDAINHKIYYQLKTNEDGSTSWKRTKTAITP